MQRHIRRITWLAAASLAVLSLTIGAVLAHEGRPVGDYRFIVGWLEEPAYEGSQNAVSIRVNKIVAGEPEEGDQDHSDSHQDQEHTVEATSAIEIETGMGGTGYGDDPPQKHDDGHKEEGDKHLNGMDNEGEGNGMAEKDGQTSTTPVAASKPLASIAGQHEGQPVPVEGLEETLRVEVTHVSSGASKTIDVYAVFGDPGHYTAALIPTAAGVYEFRVFGTIEGTSIDETFVSKGAGGGFDDIRTSSDLQFPVQLPEIREIESGMRGALQTAQQAQDAALSSQESNSGNALSIVALIVGIVGAILGGGGIFLALRARQP